MKKIRFRSFFLTCLFLITFVSCSDDNEIDLSRTETITMASGLYTWSDGADDLFTTFHLIKREGKQQWECFYSDIKGFTFEEGYETVLEVRIDPISNPAADQGNEQYTLIKVISKIQKESENLPVGAIKDHYTVSL